ncbi:hypothetical protein [Empedobacter tilapiae]|uniref:hypothetical protein n=1 Tax=Empedobacter tilapiae TaxID=2491114 RepID=UPI001FE46404|nr:hypothetical protein [Empedobacter tilapiae]
MVIPLYGQSNKMINQDSINQSKLYNEFRIDFDKYEKQYGHYIQTNNVKMHYLEWGNPKNPINYLYTFYFKNSFWRFDTSIKSKNYLQKFR